MKGKSILGLFMIICLQSCVNAPEFNDVPELTYIGMSKTSIIQTELGQDSIYVQLRFTDGDGDVGVPDGTNFQNVTVRDSRNGNIYATFSTPTIPREGANNGIDVDMTLLLLNDCCQYPPEDSIPACSMIDIYPENEFFLTFTIEDQAGNVSNSVDSDLITMKCIR